jgi:hypothetical protein
MNPKILKSLQHLKLLNQTKLLPIIFPDRFELDLIKKGLFYCLNDKSYSKNFPEEACFADFEWLCSNEGAIFLTPELDSVTIKKPFCGQFIGLSGQTYLWFQPGDYAQPKSLKYCAIGKDCLTIIVHNIAADRPMITESHLINTNEGPNFFCTMSAHLLCAGVSDQQSFNYKAGDESKFRAGGLKNLIDVFNFWSVTEWPQVLELSAKRGSALQATKKIRDIFYSNTLKDVYASLPELIKYGIEDVNKVHNIFKSLYFAWADCLPSLESQYFYLKRAKVNYSIPNYFKQWFNETEALYQGIKAEIKELVKQNNEIKIIQFTSEILAAYNQSIPLTLEDVPDQYKNKAKTKLLKKWDNPWLLAAELQPLVKAVITKWNTQYAAVNWKIDEVGFPIWYKKADDSADSPICQLLLDATYFYDGIYCPVIYDKLQKFMYQTKSGALVKVTSPKKGLNTKDNCGSILSKDFIPLWENGVLKTESEASKIIVEKMSLISYWTSVRSRLAELYVLLP